MNPPVYISQAGETGADLEPTQIANPAGLPVAEDANAEASGSGPKELTRREWKNLLRLYFTVRRPRVEACGHKIDVQSDSGPRTNCQYCWFAYFNNNGELVQSIDGMLNKRTVADPAGITATESLINMRGVKFLKNFRKFMSTVAAWKAQLEAAQEKNVQSTTGSGSESAQDRHTATITSFSDFDYSSYEAAQ